LPTVLQSSSGLERLLPRRSRHVRNCSRIFGMAQSMALAQVDRPQRRAENAEDDAAFAIDFAYAALEEAEYAALDASLARMEANELAAAPTSR
jgi:hypothetical protein